MTEVILSSFNVSWIVWYRTAGGEESDGEGLFGSPKPKRERFRRTSIAGATLMSMKKRSASGIMGHISYEVRPLAVLLAC